MVIIGAMSTDHVIGSGEGMPWDVPEEYAQFLRFIDGQTVIIGRRGGREEPVSPPHMSVSRRRGAA